MKSIIVLLLKILGGAVISIFALVVLVILAISAVLLVIVLLQLLGVVKRVPLGYNIRNLMVRWHTTLLTTLAFTLVVGLLTLMLAFVNGMFVLTSGSGVPGNVLVLAQGSIDEVFSDLANTENDKLAYQPFVEKAEVKIGDKVEVVPLVSWELFLLANQPIPDAKPGARQRRFIQIRGIEKPEVASRVHNLSLHAGGEWFSEAGVSAPKDGETFVQGVLGEGMARELGQDRGKASLQVGDEFELGPRKWVVVGILKSAGTTFDSEVWGKLSYLGDIFNKKTRTTAVIRTANADEAQKAAKYLKDEFKPAVNARTEVEYYESLNGTNKQFLWAIGFIAIFIAFGGVVGIMITMFTAIAQRTKDIGILRILGYSRAQILVSFFLESLLLALVGGVIGCAVGSISHGWTASSIIGSGQGGGKSVVLTLTVSPWILGAGMVFSLLMGCIGGLLPALSAIRVKLLDALR